MSKESIKLGEKLSVNIVHADDKHEQPIKCPSCGQLRKVIVKCEWCNHVS